MGHQTTPSKGYLQILSDSDNNNCIAENKSYVYKSSHTVKDHAERLIKSHLLLLTVEFNIYKADLPPLGASNQRTAVFRVHFLQVEDALVQVEHGCAPELLGNWEVELEIPQISKIDNVFFLYLSVRVLVGSELELFVEVYLCFLGGTVHPEQIAAEAVAEEGNVLLLTLLGLILEEKHVGVISHEEDLKAKISVFCILHQFFYYLQHLVGLLLQSLPQFMGSKQVISQ